MLQKIIFICYNNNELKFKTKNIIMVAPPGGSIFLSKTCRKKTSFTLQDGADYIDNSKT